jgi:hypothetical protein
MAPRRAPAAPRPASPGLTPEVGRPSAEQHLPALGGVEAAEFRHLAPARDHRRPRVCLDPGELDRLLEPLDDLLTVELEALRSLFLPLLSRISMDLSRGGVMVETEHPTEPDSSFHRALR